MIDISLTDFVDFVISSGTPKLTKVKTVKQRSDYHPAIDFWKPLREGIASFHRGGSQNKNDLDSLLVEVNDKKKLTRYPTCIAGYKKFLGRKHIEWFNPPWDSWGPEGIRIRVNPELGLVLNGVPHVVKLYFKSEKLSQRRIDTILQLMETALRSHVDSETLFAVLDVARGKLYSKPMSDNSLLPLLIGEATNFVTIWNSLE